MKKILVLGGTQFIGRGFVERLKWLPGMDITLFNRGKSNTDLFSDIRQIHGDRDKNEFTPLFEEHWDYVFDFSAYYPVPFANLLKDLKDKVGRFVYISTVSAYDFSKPDGWKINEQSATALCSEAQKTSPLPDAYGEKKAEMERMLFAETEMDSIVFRPSYIYGKYDWTERFYYWLYRAKFSDKILIPSIAINSTLSLTNAEDLVEGLFQSITIAKHAPAYNTISQSLVTIPQIVTDAANALNRHVEIIPIDGAQMEKHGLKLSDFPLCAPFSFEVEDGLWKKDFAFERANMAQTFSEMLSHKELAAYPKPPAGLNWNKEQEIILSLT